MCANSSCLAELRRRKPRVPSQKFNYKPKIGKAAGQLGKMFALFRDQVLPAALKYGHVRSDVEATSLSTTQDRHVKTATRADGQGSARSIQGWEFVRA